MRLEFVKIEEANDVLNQLVENHPHAIFLTDQKFQVRFFNKAFRKLTKSDKSEILNHDLCEVMGCTQHNKYGDDELKHAKNCQMRELLSGSNISELDLIRDFIINNKLVTKHLKFNTYRVVMGGQKYRFVVVEDRTHKH